jgi:hypothetical protein
MSRIGELRGAQLTAIARCLGVRLSRRDCGASFSELVIEHGA